MGSSAPILQARRPASKNEGSWISCATVRLLLQLERGADSLKLANWEEIQERLTKGLEMIQEQMKADGAGQQEAGKLASQLKTFYENREFMTAFLY